MNNLNKNYKYHIYKHRRTFLILFTIFNCVSTQYLNNNEYYDVEPVNNNSYTLPNLVPISATTEIYTSSATIGYSTGSAGSATPLPGGIITDGQHVLNRLKSPYFMREDLIIERDAELVIDPGVEIRFGPMVGITIRGVFTAVVRRSHINNSISNYMYVFKLISVMFIKFIFNATIYSNWFSVTNMGTV